MEKVGAKTALYPGCSLEGTESSYKISLEKVLESMGVDCTTLDDWNCCGATPAHALDHALYLALAMRNLELAEIQGYRNVVAPCAACYHRLASANFRLKDDAGLLSELNEETQLNYKGDIEVLNVLDYLANILGTGCIAENVVKPLAGIKVVSYYGCLNTRIPRMKSFDVMENPMSMDRIVEALGAEALDWSYKTECCGATLFVTAEPVATKLVSKIIKDAVARDADCIAVACPMCHNNLDTLQEDICTQFGISRTVPVLFVTQLMGLAFGLTASDMKLDHNFVPFEVSEQTTT